EEAYALSWRDHAQSPRTDSGIQPKVGRDAVASTLGPPDLGRAVQVTPRKECPAFMYRRRGMRGLGVASLNNPEGISSFSPGLVATQSRLPWVRRIHAGKPRSGYVLDGQIATVRQRDWPRRSTRYALRLSDGGLTVSRTGDCFDDHEARFAQYAERVREGALRLDRTTFSDVRSGPRETREAF